MGKTKIINQFTKLRRAIYIVLGRFDEIVNRKNGFVVLAYHSIDDSGWRFSVSPKEFKKQIEFMTKHYSHLELKDFLECIENGEPKKRPCFMVTLDDGYKNVKSTVSYLKNRGINPILFAISDRNKPDRQSIATKRALLSDTDLRKLSDLGWEIGSHGKTHTVVTSLDENNLKKELVNSKNDLETIIGKKITAFSYPHGKYSKEVKNEVRKAGYKIAFSADDLEIGGRVDRYAIPRVGVDNTHSFSEFKYLASPSVLAFRKLVKSTFIGRYL